MSKETQNRFESYRLPKRGETVRNIAVTAIATAAVAVPVAMVANHAARGPEVNYTGTQEVPAGNGTNPTEMVRDNVEYDSNEVPTDEIVDYVVDLPKNQDVMKDGLGAGETLIMPEKAEKAD